MVWLVQKLVETVSARAIPSLEPVPWAAKMAGLAQSVLRVRIVYTCMYNALNKS